VGSARSAKIKPYLDYDENEVNESSLKSAFLVSNRDSSLGNRAAKQNKLNLPPSSKVDGIIKLHLNSQKNGFPSDVDTEDNVLEANRENWSKECEIKSCDLESNLSHVKRNNMCGSFENDFAPPLKTSHSNHIKTKASEALLGRTSYVLLKKLNFEMGTQKECVEDGNRSSSPTIPLTGIRSLVCISRLLVQQRSGFY
jgi:hypothetical protein